MKVCAGISTLNRNTSTIVAKSLRPFVDELVVVAQGKCDLDDLPTGTKIIRQDPGLANARNSVFQAAIDSNSDIIIQSDDDLRAKPNAIEKMIEELKNEPRIGALSLGTDFFWVFGARTITTNKPWIIAPFPGNIWGTRMTHLEEIGLPIWKYEVLEDMYVGLRLWRVGRPVFRLHVDRSSYTSSILTRADAAKGNVVGGQLPSTRLQHIQETTNKMEEEFVPDMLKYIRYSIRNENDETKEKDIKVDVRYNWKNILQKSIDRWGYIGYEDSKGRKI